MSQKGKLITFEGIDGCGKSTHIDWLANKLRTAGKEVLITREPGGTPLGEKIRDLLLHDNMSVMTEALLFVASRNEHLINVINPALESGVWVISDRYVESNYAYQSGGRGLHHEVLDTLAHLINTKPSDLILLFDIPVATAQARMVGTREKDRFELEQIAFHQRVSNIYTEMTKLLQNRKRIQVINASKTIEEIRVDLTGIIDSILET